ncbi:MULTISPECIES: DUF4153 domain-containing protein [unclassified Micromonospora]|uniref:DUF4153 domain-containing protein n=1 Tax=unclassified Micromonospora TaxID=2617518 RepID=UPI001C233616|nr:MULTISPECIES: DUF4153 domain-containing protein [unclassified Micromonospora]MBU8859054.1 DUF4173 domain-containing protein [Micromonospora sp. WMMB482]MDM4778558.1 DUF4173 domain-containing protein [Micromonospora sp. b486]
MSEPVPSPEPSRAAPAAGPAPGDVPAPAQPHLLVLPTMEGAPRPVPWPGAEGQPGWAIPVSVPPGTQGYALFLPLVPAPGQPAAAVPTQAAAPAAERSPAEGSVPSAGTGGRAPAAVSTAVEGSVPPSGASGSTTGAGSTPVEGGATAATEGGRPVAPAPAGRPAGGEPVAALPDAVPTARPEQAGGTSPATGDAAVSTSELVGAEPSVPAATPAGAATADSGGSGTGMRPGDGAPQTATSATSDPAGASQTPAAPAGPPPASGSWAAPGAQGAPGTPPPHGGGPMAAPPYPGMGWGGHPQAQTWAPRPPVPRTSFLGARWPGPKAATGRAAPLAVLAAAVGSAVFVPLGRVGVGWFLGWLTLTLAVVLAVRSRTADLPRADKLIRAGWAVAALALIAVPAFRNAWWLVTFCVLGALGCATLAIVGGRLVRSILFGLVATPFAALRGLPWVRRHITASPQEATVRKVTVSVVATVVVLVVFGSLLASADAAFSEALGSLVPEINVGTVFGWLFLAVVGGLIAVAALYTLAAPPDLSTVDRAGERRLGLLEWAPAIGALTLLFAGFVVVQFTTLFGGQRHVQRVAGLSYAEYARSGFWQLLFVTLLTVAVLGGVSRWARRERTAERILLRVLLGLISALSVVIVASALSRMWTYQKVYSFTGERIFVMAFEMLLGTVFLMIIAAGVKWQGRWIPGTTLALAVAMLLGLAVLNPEAYVARRNTLRYEQTGKIDAWYLRALSADATPALVKLPDSVRRCTLSWIADDLAEPDPWYAWNLGRQRARKALEEVGPQAVGGPKDCRRADQFDLPKTRRPR